MTSELRYVIDTNVGIKLFINDPLTPKVNQLFDRLNDPSVHIFIPDLFYVECANVLWKYVRANLYTAAQVKSDLQDLKALALQVTSTKDLMSQSLEISCDYGITAYDSCYVALSEQVGATLLTLDERLVNTLTGSNFEIKLFTSFDLV